MSDVNANLSNRPIVHRAGGMLLQARKEFAICADLRPEDVFFYYTTTYVPSQIPSTPVRPSYDQAVNQVVLFADPQPAHALFISSCFKPGEPRSLNSYLA